MRSGVCQFASDRPRLVYVLCDVQKDSFLAAFNVEDGRELWRTSRQDVPTWGSPVCSPPSPIRRWSSMAGGNCRIQPRNGHATLVVEGRR